MARQTAEFVLMQAEHPGDVQVERRPEDHADRKRRIRQLRGGLRENPRNAVRWVELARQYTTEGHTAKATNAMRLAVALAPRDRFTLRCAVRLWLHLSDPERALRTLSKARRTVLVDPWLLATDLAATATAGRPARNAKRARHMLDAKSHTPFALSELASALATLELHAGQSRRARKLFSIALLDPNENSVAQAEWASHHLLGLNIDAHQLEQSPEARALDRAEDDDAVATLTAASDWLIDQPFSSEPAIFGSYHASMHQLFEEGARFAEEGLRANPRDPVLLNNRAFCLASMGRWQQAERLLREADQHARAEDEPTLKATWGLVRFRAGDAEDGRRLYREAIDALSDPVQRLRAELILTSEEARAGQAGAGDQAAALVRHVEGLTNRDMQVWIRYLPGVRPKGRADSRGSK